MPKRWAATTRFCRRSSSSQSHQLPGFCGFVNTPTRLPPPHPPFTQQVYKIGFDFFFFAFSTKTVVGFPLQQQNSLPAR